MFKDNNVKTPQELLEYFIDNFRYGFTYKSKIFTDDEPNFQEKMDKFYRIRLGKDFIKHKYGVCWDFCELERLFLFEDNLEHECYFIESYTDDGKIGGQLTHSSCIQKMTSGIGLNLVGFAIVVYGSTIPNPMR